MGMMTGTDGIGLELKLDLVLLGEFCADFLRIILGFCPEGGLPADLFTALTSVWNWGFCWITEALMFDSNSRCELRGLEKISSVRFLTTDPRLSENTKDCL